MATVRAGGVCIFVALFALAGRAGAARIQASQGLELEAAQDSSPIVGSWIIERTWDTLQYHITEASGGQLQLRLPMHLSPAFAGRVEPLGGNAFRTVLANTRAMHTLGAWQLRYDAEADTLTSALDGGFQNLDREPRRYDIRKFAERQTARRAAAGEVELECPAASLYSRPLFSGCRCPESRRCRDPASPGTCSGEDIPRTCAACTCESFPEIEARGAAWVSIAGAGAVTISRQGQVVTSVRDLRGSTFGYNFSTSDLHRVFVVSAEDEEGSRTEEVFFVAEGEPDLCGVGLFTAPSLQCSTLSAGEAEAAADAAAGYMDEIYPMKELSRGFGVEFEFVSREVPDELVEEKAGEIEALAACFESRTGSAAKYSDWKVMRDSSVKPLTKGEAAFFASRGEGGEGEAVGAGFEIVSPGPPHVLAGRRGMRSVVEVLGILRGMGVQAGPSAGLHVHVNVGSKEAPGLPLTYREVAFVWAAYAKYQLVIDEVLSPSRIHNRYAKPLFLGEGGDHEVKGFFLNMHRYLGQAGGGPERTLEDFCNAALGGSTTAPCKQRYPQERYYALNLVPLERLGTVEFRSHSATHDRERVLHWALFAVAFVEHFGGAGRGEGAAFFRGAATADLGALARAQKEATAEALFSALTPTLTVRTFEYFRGRAWERNAAGCD